MSERQARNRRNADRNAGPAQAWTDAQRSEALQLAEEVGAAAAGRELGIPAATIRGWRHRAGEVGPPAGADPQDWAERKAADADDAWQVATEARKQAMKLLKAGKPGDAQRAALTAAIMWDKSDGANTTAMQAAARQAAISQARAETIAAVIRAVFEDVGVPIDGPVRKVIGHYLQQAVDDGTLTGPAPEAEEAKREVQMALGVPRAGSVRPEGEPLALPAPITDPEARPDPQDDKEAEMIGPKRVVRTLRERRKRKREDEEVVEGEVVEDEATREERLRRAARAGRDVIDFRNPERRWD